MIELRENYRSICKIKISYNNNIIRNIGYYVDFLGTNNSFESKRKKKLKFIM